MRGWPPGQGTKKLLLEHFLRIAGLAVGKHLADAEDGCQSRCECSLHLAVGAFVGLTKDLPALGMRDDHSAAARLDEHSRRYFAGECTLIRPVNVLRRDSDRRTFGRVDTCRN